MNADRTSLRSIAGAALGKQQFDVVSRQRVLPGEAGFIDRDAEQQSPFIVGQQFSAALGALRAGPASMAPNTVNSTRVVGGYSDKAAMLSWLWRDFPGIPYVMPTPFVPGSAEAGARPTVVGVSV